MRENESRFLSRRQAVSVVGISMVAGAAAPGIGRGTDGNSNSPVDGEPNMTDPRTKYPKPPFKAQTQPWPGLAGKMDPKPDHGEQSYRGSSRLAGRKALITGGDSGMGRAAARGSPDTRLVPRRIPLGIRHRRMTRRVSYQRSGTLATLSL